jgi:hypothetical protein
MSVVESPEAVEEQEPQEQPRPGEHVEAAAEQSRQTLFKYSEWVHVGIAADTCEHREDGKCEDDEHFHAWVRLPNPYQVRDITEKAQAAKARKLRALRNLESDERAIIEAELDELSAGGEEMREILVLEVIERDYNEDYMRAVREVRDEDDPTFVPKDDEDIPKLYEHLEQDEEEYQRLKLLPEDERPPEFEQLQSHLADFSRKVEEAIKRFQEPRQKALTQKPLEELIDLVREDRIAFRAGEEYLHVFNTWVWFVCTYKTKRKPLERYFKDINDMRYSTSPEVVTALRMTFNDLERLLATSRSAKNS